jgi:hypothetical protein
MHIRTRHLRTWIAASLAAAAVAVPAAQATPPPTEIPYLSQGQGVTPADLGIATGTSPDDRAVARTEPAAEATPAGPEIPYLSQGQGVTPADLGIATGTSPDDRPFARVVPRTERGIVPVEALASSHGFDWGDATIGGTFGLVLALVVAGAFLIGNQRRRSLRSA